MLYIKGNRDIETEEIRKCLLCNHEGKLLYQNLCDRIYNAPGIWNLWHCDECNLVWLNPRPTPSSLRLLYDSQENFYTHEIPSVETSSGWKKILRNAILAANYGYIHLSKGSLKQFLGKFLFLFWPIRRRFESSLIYNIKWAPDGKFLDIGCGNGSTLVKMQELGWMVFGVEPDKEAARIAREILKLNVYEGFLEEANFSDNTFDVVFMSHVIEHTFNPIATLKECYRILKLGGLLILVTPNIRRLCSLIFKDKYFSLYPPYHFYLFSADTLYACAKKAGFMNIKIQSTTRQANFVWAGSRMIQKIGKCPAGFPGIKNRRLLLEGRVFKFFEETVRLFLKDIGEELILYAFKG